MPNLSFSPTPFPAPASATPNVQTSLITDAEPTSTGCAAVAESIIASTQTGVVLGSVSVGGLSALVGAIPGGILGLFCCPDREMIN